MGNSRLSRFKRAAATRPIQLTERDHEIIRLVNRHRFLRSSHILALIGGSGQPLLRRLQLLFHHGYLERPRAQLAYYQTGGSHFMAYGLGNKGAKLLQEKPGTCLRHLRWNEKNQSVGRLFLEHALLVSDVMVALELGARNLAGVTYIPSDALPRPEEVDPSHPFQWRVRLKGGAHIGIVPDGVFALDTIDVDRKTNRAFFFLEADRGTMPIVRKNLSQTSIYRKLLVYEATWNNGLHQTLFGFHRFRVLTVTTSAARAASLIEACAKLKSGHGLFLFCDAATLKQQGNIFAAPWKNGKGEPSTLLA